MPLNLDAVQEMSLQTSSYAAEYGRASGGIINVVTKAGGSLFTGSFDIRYDDNSFTEDSEHFDNSQVKSGLTGPNQASGSSLSSAASTPPRSSRLRRSGWRSRPG